MQATEPARHEAIIAADPAIVRPGPRLLPWRRTAIGAAAVVSLALMAGCAGSDVPVCRKIVSMGQHGHGMKVVPCPVEESSAYSSMKSR